MSGLTALPSSMAMSENSNALRLDSTTACNRQIKHRVLDEESMAEHREGYYTP